MVTHLSTNPAECKVTSLICIVHLHLSQTVTRPNSLSPKPPRGSISCHPNHHQPQFSVTQNVTIPCHPGTEGKEDNEELGIL